MNCLDVYTSDHPGIARGLRLLTLGLALLGALLPAGTQFLARVGAERRWRQGNAETTYAAIVGLAARKWVRELGVTSPAWEWHALGRPYIAEWECSGG